MDGRLTAPLRRTGRAGSTARIPWRLASTVALAALAGCAVAPHTPIPTQPGSDSPPAAPGECPATLGQQMLAQINRIRTDHGLDLLTVDSRIVAAARLHADDQAKRDAISHYGSDGSTSGDRLVQAGYAWSMASENVGAGYAGAAAMVEAWMNSPPHRSTILAPEARHAGVGFAYRPDSRLRFFWTLDVARPADPEDARELPCHP